MPTFTRTDRPTSEPSALAGAPMVRVAPPAKRQRRPILTLAGIALVLLAGLGAALAYRSLGTGHDVVAVRQTVHRGEVITAQDLMTVRIGLDPALHPLSSDQLAATIGKRAAMDLPAGGVVTRDAVTEQVTPPAGASLIGISMTSAQMPSEPLRAGDKVRLVAVPKQATEASAGTPDTVTGTVVSSRPSARGDGMVVDVEVPVADAPTWAARAALNQVALTLETRER
jgi:hypothetical protein